MKVLIWMGCILFIAIVKVAIESSLNVNLGAIPMVALYYGGISLARHLCAKVDERRGKS